MQNTTNNTNDSNTGITPKKQRPWYQSQGLAVTMSLISLFNLMVSTAIVGGQAQNKPSILILKNEGCSYFKQYGIPTKPNTIDSTCTAEVEFRHNFISDGGVIIYQDRRISLAPSLIVAVQTIQVSPWVPDNIDGMIWLGVCLIIVFVMLSWMGSTFQRGLDK